MGWLNDRQVRWQQSLSTTKPISSIDVVNHREGVDEKKARLAQSPVASGAGEARPERRLGQLLWLVQTGSKPAQGQMGPAKIQRVHGIQFHCGAVSW